MPPSHNTFACEPASAVPVVVLIADGIDWHARTLTKAFAAQGVRTIPTSLQACGMETQGATGLNIPGLGGRSDHCKDVIVVVRRTRKSGERPERLQNDLPDNVLGRLLVRI